MLEVRVGDNIFTNSVISFDFSIVNPLATPFTLTVPRIQANMKIKVAAPSLAGIVKGAQVSIYKNSQLWNILYVADRTFVASKSELEIVCEFMSTDLLFGKGRYDLGLLATTTDSYIESRDGEIVSVDPEYVENWRDAVQALAWAGTYKRDIVPGPFVGGSRDKIYLYGMRQSSSKPKFKVYGEDIVEYDISTYRPTITELAFRKRAELEIDAKFTIPKAGTSVAVHSLVGSDFYAVEYIKNLGNNKYEHRVKWSDGFETNLDFTGSTSTTKKHIVGITEDSILICSGKDLDNNNHFRLIDRMTSEYKMPDTTISGGLFGNVGFDLVSSDTYRLSDGGSNQKRFFVRAKDIVQNSNYTTRATVGLILTEKASSQIEEVFVDVSQVQSYLSPMFSYSSHKSASRAFGNSHFEFMEVGYSEEGFFTFAKIRIQEDGSVADVSSTTYWDESFHVTWLNRLESVDIRPDNQLSFIITVIKSNPDTVAYSREILMEGTTVVSTETSPHANVMHIPNIQLFIYSRWRYFYMTSRGQLMLGPSLNWDLLWDDVSNEAPYQIRPQFGLEYRDKVIILNDTNEYKIVEQLYYPNALLETGFESGVVIAQGESNPFAVSAKTGYPRQEDFKLWDTPQGRMSLQIVSFRDYSNPTTVYKVADLNLPPITGIIEVAIKDEIYKVKTTSLKLIYDGMYRLFIDGVIIE